jgi:hypothetical protein
MRGGSANLDQTPEALKPALGYVKADSGSM